MDVSVYVSPEARHLLREWAYYFRNRRKRMSCGSVEKNWRSPQCWDAPEPRPDYQFLRACRTNDYIMPRIPWNNRLALTWRYCYPWEPVYKTLRIVSRKVGYRLNLREFDDLVVLGELRFSALLGTT